jgi:hypothetical protein
MGSVSKIVKHLKTERGRAEKHLSALNLALAAFGGDVLHRSQTQSRTQLDISAQEAIDFGFADEIGNWSVPEGKSILSSLVAK